MGRRCTVCVSEHHLAVDGEIMGGARPAELARRYQLDAEAITRHRNNHLSPALMRGGISKAHRPLGREGVPVRPGPGRGPDGPRLRGCCR